jgi:sensor histidine kinase regulating citrate/malate metabolism
MFNRKTTARFSFRAKVLVPVITVMVVVLAVTFFVVSVRFQNQMWDNAKRELATASRSTSNICNCVSAAWPMSRAISPRFKH